MLSYKVSTASFSFILSRNTPVTSSRKKLFSQFLSSLDSASLFMHHTDFICLSIALICIQLSKWQLSGWDFPGGCSPRTYQITCKKQMFDLEAPNSGTPVNSAATAYPLHITIKKNGDTSHPCRSSIPTMNDLWFNSANTDTNFWSGIQWLNGQ